MHLPRVQKAAGDWSRVCRDFWAGDIESTVLGVAQVWQSAHDDLHPVRGHRGKKAVQEEPLPVGEAEENAPVLPTTPAGKWGRPSGSVLGTQVPG